MRNYLPCRGCCGLCHILEKIRRLELVRTTYCPCQEANANFAIRTSCRRLPKMVRLFPSSEIFVSDQPEKDGFYDLEFPDAFRWMKHEARCLLPAEKITGLASPVLRITASIGQGERYLSVY